jgi:hypothetical protein
LRPRKNASHYAMPSRPARLFWVHPSKMAEDSHQNSKPFVYLHLPCRRKPRRGPHFQHGELPDPRRAIDRQAHYEPRTAYDRIPYACTRSCAHFGNQSWTGAARKKEVLAFGQSCLFRRMRRRRRQSPPRRRREDI